MYPKGIIFQHIVLLCVPLCLNLPQLSAKFRTEFNQLFFRKGSLKAGDFPGSEQVFFPFLQYAVPAQIGEKVRQYKEDQRQDKRNGGGVKHSLQREGIKIKHQRCHGKQHAEGKQQFPVILHITFHNFHRISPSGNQVAESLFCHNKIAHPSFLQLLS